MYPRARCMGCLWVRDAATREEASTHETDTGHRVVMWDSPTSTLPRQAWGSVLVWGTR